MRLEEAAIDWALEIALRELARYVGLDYKEIVSGEEEYETLQQRRAVRNKRTRADETLLVEKRIMLAASVGQKPKSSE